MDWLLSVNGQDVAFGLRAVNGAQLMDSLLETAIKFRKLAEACALPPAHEAVCTLWLALPWACEILGEQVEADGRTMVVVLKDLKLWRDACYNPDVLDEVCERVCVEARARWLNRAREMQARKALYLEEERVDDPRYE